MAWRDECPRSVVLRVDAFLAAMLEAGYPHREVRVSQPAPGRDPEVTILWKDDNPPPEHVRKMALLVVDGAPGAAPVKGWRPLDVGDVTPRGNDGRG